MDTNQTEYVSNRQRKLQANIDLNRTTQFSDIDITSKRQDNELYCDYKCRMWWVHRITKRYLQGRPIWGMGNGQKFGKFKRQ